MPLGTITPRHHRTITPQQAVFGAQNPYSRADLWRPGRVHGLSGTSCVWFKPLLRLGQSLGVHQRRNPADRHSAVLALRALGRDLQVLLAIALRDEVLGRDV